MDHRWRCSHFLEVGIHSHGHRWEKSGSQVRREQNNVTSAHWYPPRHLWEGGKLGGWIRTQVW